MMFDRPIPYLVAVLIGMAVVTGSYMQGATSTRERLEAQHLAEMNGLRADLEAKAAAAEREAREAEQRHVQAMADVEAKYQREITDAQIEYDRIVDDLRAGTLRLRDKFTCSAGESGGGAKAGAGTGTRTGATQGGLSAEDQEFLIRIGREADDAVRQLHACQAVVRRDRGEQ